MIYLVYSCTLLINYICSKEIHVLVSYKYMYLLTADIIYRESTRVNMLYVFWQHLLTCYFINSCQSVMLSLEFICLKIQGYGNSQSCRTLFFKSSESLVNWNWAIYKVHVYRVFTIDQNIWHLAHYFYTPDWNSHMLENVKVTLQLINIQFGLSLCDWLIENWYFHYSIHKPKPSL